MRSRSGWINWLRGGVAALLAVALAAGLWALAASNLPQRLGLGGPSEPASTAGPAGHVPGTGDDHGHDHNHDHGQDHDHGHDHDHAGHSDEDSLWLTPQARANLRLRLKPVSLGTFRQYIQVPATVAEWPGRTHVAITSPLTGVINAIYVSRGELVESGTPLFTLRLTHQDLVETQEQFLASLGQLDIEQREIARLSSLADSGAVAGKTLITRQYERDRLQASIQAARQSMMLHGLTSEQIAHIEQTRQLIREVTIHAPTLHADRSLHHDSLHEMGAGHASPGDSRAASWIQPTTEGPRTIDAQAVSAAQTILTQPALTQPPVEDHEHVEAEFLVTELDVSRGESVDAGERLGQLSDYSQLLIEGYGYQRDSEMLRRAADEDLALQAVLESSEAQPEVVEDLRIAYIGNEIDPQSRSLSFFVPLDNEVERFERVGQNRFVSWRYKPGQRLRLRVPAAVYDDVIVVPRGAVAEEGAERYVFVESGDHFDRVPVRVVAGDSLQVAIADDGQLKMGQWIAINAAHQLQMALKNRSGGGIDPHAGHNH